MGVFLSTSLRVGSAESHLTLIGRDSVTGMAQAAIVDSSYLVHTSQIFPLDESGKLMRDGIVSQTRRVLSNLEAKLLTWNSAYTQLANLRIYISNTNDIAKVREVLLQMLNQASRPAATFIVTPLPYGALVAVDAVAVVDPTRNASTPSISAQSVLPEFHEQGISAASGPASGCLFYVSGMADTNKLPDATRITLTKLMSAIENLGLGKSDVLQLRAFFRPMSEVATVRRVIVDYFQSNAPPTVFVEWLSPAPNPPIEIELVAAGKTGATNDSDSVAFLTPPGTTSTKVFSRVAKVNRGKLIFISGMYGMHAQEPGGEITEIFESLGKILKSTGSDFEHLVKATYYVSDDVAGNKLNEIRPKFFNPLRPPAASKAMVTAVGVADKTVAVDMIAVTK